MRNTKFMALALVAFVTSGLLDAKASAAPTNGMSCLSTSHQRGPESPLASPLGLVPSEFAPREISEGGWHA